MLHSAFGNHDRQAIIVVPPQPRRLDSLTPPPVVTHRLVVLETQYGLLVDSPVAAAGVA